MESFFKHKPKLQEAFNLEFGDRVLFDEPIATHVAYQIGGPADALVFPKSEEELLWIKAQAEEHGFSTTMIGKGTNLLVRDEGIRGVVISFTRGFNQIEILSQSDSEIRVLVGAGAEKPALLEWAIEHSFSGLEFSAGVPGTLGGGLYMNAGTKYGCYADILESFTVFDFSSGIEQFTREAFSFGYRHQTAFNHKRVVTSMVFILKHGDKNQIRTEVDRIIAERAEKQPLDYPSCGSTFKNPEGYSAGRLIEKAGLKGTRAGGAEISLKHANFFLNKNGAKARDILELIDLTQKTVQTQFNVHLECEVIILP